MKLSSLLLLSFAFITQYTRSHEPHDSNKAANDPNSDYDPSSIKIIEENIVKPVLDNSEYRVVKLPNGIETVLISDPSTVRAGASLGVRTGYKDDPDEFPGLAHFCEHMLFLGSQKYPHEDEYRNFLGLHYGRYNAYTSLDQTVYFFDIDSKYLYEQLDRQANLFINPLFNEDLIERESHAVNSEFKLSFYNEEWHRFQIITMFLRKSGPFSKFPVGSRQTLFSEPRAKNSSVKSALENFFNKYYKSRSMVLIIYGKESLDTLQEWAQKTFGQIPDGTSSEVLNAKNPLEDLPGYHYYYKTYGTPKLYLNFPVPSRYVQYKTIPTYYLIHLLSFRGVDSPTDYLIGQGLILGSSFSYEQFNDEYDMLEITFVLTTKGASYYTKVIEEFLKCLRFYKDSGPNKEIFEELRKSQNLVFKYRSKVPVMEYLKGLSVPLLNTRLPRKYLLNSEFLKEYDENEIKNFFSYLTPKNLLSVLASSNEKYNQTDPYFGFQFKERHDIRPIERLENVTAVPLAFPFKNIYLSSDPEVTMEKLDSPVVKPDLIKSTSITSLWYKYGSFFHAPFGTINILLKNPFVGVSSANIVKLIMLQRYLFYSLSIDQYYATLAGIKYDISFTTQGILLSLSGYSDKIMKIFSTLMNVLKRLNFSYDAFLSLKHSLYRAFFSESPSFSQTLKNELENTIPAETRTSDEKFLELMKLQHSDLTAFLHEYLSNLHFDILILGNIPPQDAIHISNTLEEIFHPYALMPSQYTYPRAITLENGSNNLLFLNVSNDKNVDSGIFIYYEATQIMNRRKQFLFKVLFRILKQPVYNHLRTKEQLGYAVRFDTQQIRTIMGFTIFLQGQRQPHVLQLRIDNFFTTFLEHLKNITAQDLSYYVESVIRGSKIPPYSMMQETQNIWGKIYSGSYFSSDDFSDLAQTVKLEDVIELFKEVFYSGRRRVSFHLSSQVDRDIFNVFDLPLDKISKYLTTLLGESVSEGELYECILLSHDISHFRLELTKYLSKKNDDTKKVESLVNNTFEFLKNQYSLQKKESYEPLNLISDMVYFKANSTLSPSFINASLWSKFYKWQ